MTGWSVWYFSKNGWKVLDTAMKKWSFGSIKGSSREVAMVSKDDEPGFGIFLDLTASTYVSMDGQISTALSATGKLSNQRWPQKCKGNTEDLVIQQKSSLLAGAQLNSECKAFNSLSIYHFAKPCLKALCRVWSPQLPTTASCDPPNCSICSCWSSSKNFQFTFGPSIDIDTIFHKFSFSKHSWE